MSSLKLDLRDGIALVTIDRPPANTLNHAFFVELTALSGRLDEPDVRSAVITGAGRFFSAGLDLFEVLDYDERAFQAFARAFDEAFCALFGVGKPVVAAVNGHAIAGGAVIAASCDVRLMADGPGRAGLTEIQVGVPLPTTALEPVRFSCAGPHLPELLYRGLTYEPREALRRGLVDEVVPAEELLARATALAAELGGRATHAFAGIKRALRAQALGRMLEVRASGDPIWNTWLSGETRAAMEAYRRRALEKKATGR